MRLCVPANMFRESAPVLAKFKISSPKYWRGNCRPAAPVATPMMADDFANKIIVFAGHNSSALGMINQIDDSLGADLLNMIY